MYMFAIISIVFQQAQSLPISTSYFNVPSSPYTNITCLNSLSCNITCSLTHNSSINNTTDFICANRIMDGTETRSLHVICSHCNQTTIYCPVVGTNLSSNSTTECLIECVDQYSCVHLSIYSHGNTHNIYTLNIQCSSYSCIHVTIYVSNISTFNLVANGSGTHALQHMIVHSDNVSNVNIGCTIDHACYDLSMYIKNVDHMQLDCTHHGSCNNTHFNLSKSSFVELNCIKQYSCYGLDIAITKADVIAIHAREQYSLTHSSLRNTESSSLSMFCSSNVPSACDGLSLYVPSSGMNGNVNVSHNLLSCGNYGCGHMDIYTITMQDLKVEMDSDCDCESVTDCILSWDLYCHPLGIVYTNKSIFDGATCNGSCCDDVAQDMQLSYEYHDNECHNDTETTSMNIATEMAEVSEDGYGILDMEHTLLLSIAGLVCFVGATFVILRRKKKTSWYKARLLTDSDRGMLDNYIRLEDYIEEEQYKPPSPRARLFQEHRESYAIRESEEMSNHDQGLVELVGGIQKKKITM
eukprot:388698_1